METVLYYDPLPLVDSTGLKNFLLAQNVLLKPVSSGQLHQTIGYLAGLEGCAPRPAPEAPARIAEAVMVFCGFTRPRLDQVLDAMKAAPAIPKALKAVLTPTNSAWPFHELCAELQAERAEIARAARQKGG